MLFIVPKLIGNRNLKQLIIDNNFKSIVEFGTSFGISTLFLAQGILHTGGNIITTELLESKAEKAIELLKQASEDGIVYEVALLDVNMPEVDGYMLAEQIQQQFSSLDIPLVMLTSSSEKLGVKESLKLNIQSHLSKPIKQSELFTQINVVINQHHRQIDEVQHSDNAVKDTDNIENINILLAEDNKVNQMLAKKILTNAGHQVTIANNGKEAFDLYQEQQNKFDLIFVDYS